MKTRVFSPIPENCGLKDIYQPEADFIADSLAKRNAELEATAYARARKEAYPSIAEQLDQIYHEGIDAWKETIAAVKTQHPKPEAN